MKTRGVREAKQDLSGVLEEAQIEPVLILRHGKPLGMLVGVGKYDIDDVALMTNAEFWKTIEARRKQRTHAHEDVGRELFGKRKRARRRARG